MRPGEDAPAMHRYRFGSTTFAVSCDDADVARWLDEFVTPWFAPSPEAGPSDHTLRFSSSRTACDALDAAAATAATRRTPCFALDHQVLWLPVFAQRDALVIVERERCCFHRIVGADVEIVTQPGNRSARIALLRVLRELAVTRLRMQPGVLDLHAAAFAVDGRALLLVGPRQAGKTTLLVHALASGSAELIANDRVLVDAGGACPIAYGGPTAVRVRPRTFAWVPRIRAGVPPGAKILLLHAGEVADALGAEPGAERPFALSPRQLARRLGAGCRERAPVAAILFPEVASGGPSQALERLAPASATQRLRRGLYGVETLPRPATAFETAKGLQRSDPDLDVAERLAGAVPCFRWRLGPGAYDDPAERRALQGTLLELARSGAPS